MKAITLGEFKKGYLAALQTHCSQDLLGIHIRLLVLRGEVTTFSENVGKEVDLTQRVVQKVVATINRVLRDFETPHEK